MSTNPAEGSQEELKENPPADTEQQQENPPAGSEEQGTPPAESSKEDLTELPEWARKQITRANSEAAARRVAERELQAKLEAAVTPEDHEKIVQELRTENQKLVRQTTISSLVEEFELPSKASALIKGDTPEELRAAAEALAEILPKRDPDLPPPLDPQGGRQPGRPPAADPKELADIAAKRRRRF